MKAKVSKVTPIKKRKPKALPGWEDRFIEALGEWPNVSRAAKKIGVSRWEVYRTRREKPLFASRFDEARKLGWESVEDSAIDMAPTNPTMMIFMLKNNKPDRYSDRHVVETWQDRVIALLKEKKVTVGQVANEFGSDVATDLAIAAGLPFGEDSEVGTASGAQPDADRIAG